MRIIVIAVLLFLAVSIRAQYIPNNDFEEWTETGNDTLPSGWVTSASGVGRTTDAAHGKYAIKLWNWHQWYQGMISIGKAGPSWDPLALGTPFPLKGKGTFILSGEYKYYLGLNGGGPGFQDDSIMVVVFLKKFNYQTQRQDTIAYVQKKLGPVEPYTPFSIPIYVDRDSVDSLSLGVYSSVRGVCQSIYSNGECLYLTLDNLSASFFEGLHVGKHDIDQENTPFPNPFTDVVSFGTADKRIRVVISDLLGNAVHDSWFDRTGEILISTSEYPKGIYFYWLMMPDGVRTGKLVKT